MRWVLVTEYFQISVNRRKQLVASVTHMSKELNEYCLIGLHLHWKDAVNKDIARNYISVTDCTLFILIVGMTTLSLHCWAI